MTLSQATLSFANNLYKLCDNLPVFEIMRIIPQCNLAFEKMIIGSWLFYSLNKTYESTYKSDWSKIFLTMLNGS